MTSVIGQEPQLRVRRPCTQFPRNSTRNPQSLALCISFGTKVLRDMGIARKRQVPRRFPRRPKASRTVGGLDAAIRRNLEVLGYGA